MTEVDEQHLTISGYQELQTIAKHYKATFPELLTEIYAPEKFRFRFTNTERTNASFHAFAEGLFGPGASERIFVPPPQTPDYLLRPFEDCPAWKKNEESKDNPQSEEAKFIKSADYQQMVRDVSTRLGFRFALSDEQIDTIWDMCRFEQAWTVDKVSTWCAAFTRDQVDLLEYKEDIKYYYKSGYGRELNSKIPCELFKDLLNFFKSQSDPNVAAYFSHSDMINTFLVALKAFKDERELKADNLNQMRRRLWKTSRLSPFAANIVAVKYK